MSGFMSTQLRILGPLLGAVALVAGGCDLASNATQDAAIAPDNGSAASHEGHHGNGQGTSLSRNDRARAQLATAAFQDVKTAEAAGWQSSLQELGCFQDPRRGGMGVHYINDSLLDDTVAIKKPEALVYEMDADGAVTGLVAHEYIVPVDAWSEPVPPRLFGVAFHRHPTLPLYVLHAWLWKANARGEFDDWNPAVRLCPPDAPVFGEGLPVPQD